jgi:hypothetical protein
VNAEPLLVLFVFGIGLLPMAVIGVWCLFYTHKAIDVVLKIFNKINIFGVKPYSDPHGSFVVSLYRIGGLLLLLYYVLPLLLIIYIES